MGTGKTGRQKRMGAGKKINIPVFSVFPDFQK
jgi:hypothetical protein